MKTDNRSNSGRQRPTYVDPVLQTVSPIVYILLRPSSQRCSLGDSKLPNHPRRTPQYHTPRRHHHSLRHQRIRPNNRLRAYQCSIQDRRAHSNQALILDGAGVDDRGVADRDMATEDAGEIISEVQHRVVLNVRIVADHNAIDVAAEDGVVPNAGVRAEGNIAENNGGAGDVNIRTERGLLAEKCIKLMCEFGHVSILSNRAPESKSKKTKSPHACQHAGPVGRFLPRNSVVTPMTVMVTMTTKGNVKSERRAVMMMPVVRMVMIWSGRDHDRRRINHRCGLINHRRRLVNDWLLHDDVTNHRRRLRVNHSRLLHHDLPNNRRGLMHDNRRRLLHDHRCLLINYRRGLNINRWRRRIHMDGLRLERLCQEEAGPYSCHHFAGGGPFLIAGLHARNRSSHEGQRCRYDKGSFHNLLFCWLRRGRC